MKLNSSEAAVHLDSVEVQERSNVEIDLYARLVEFELLTPEEQTRLVVRPEIESSQANPPEVVAQSNECVSDLEDTSSNVVSAVVAEQANPAEYVGNQSLRYSDDVEQHFLGDAQAEVSTIESDADSSEKESPIITPDNESLVVSYGIADQDDAAVASGNLSSEPAEDAYNEIVGAATAQGNVEDNSETSESESNNVVRSSDSLENLDSVIEFAGTLSRGVCLACGADSPTDDLFCLACGVFIEDMT